MLGLPSAQAAWLCPPARSRQARRQTGEVGSSPGRACPPRGQLPALTCRQSPPHAGDRLRRQQARPGPTACDPRSVRLALRGSRSSRTPGRPGAAQLAARPSAGLRRRAMTRAAACPREPSAPAEARKAGAPPASGPKASSVASLITSTTRVKRRPGARLRGAPLAAWRGSSTCAAPGHAATPPRAKLCRPARAGTRRPACRACAQYGACARAWYSWVRAGCVPARGASCCALAHRTAGQRGQGGSDCSILGQAAAHAHVAGCYAPGPRSQCCWSLAALLSALWRPAWDVPARAAKQH